MLRPALAWLAAAALAFALVTWAALESGGVAVLRTRTQGGAPRATRVWVAETDGAVLVEAATPERPWYRDVLRDPIVELEREGRSAAFRASPEPGGEGHRRIRSLLRERYGWRDAWVGLLQDTSASIAVRLEPVR